MRRKKDHRGNFETKTISKIQCKRCARDTPKRVVVKRNPIQNVTEELPENIKKEGYKEFLCINEIRLKGRNGKWSEEVCENRMIRKLKNIIELNRPRICENCYHFLREFTQDLCTCDEVAEEASAHDTCDSFSYNDMFLKEVIE